MVRKEARVVSQASNEVPMKTKGVEAFLDKATTLSDVMLESGRYITKELPNVKLSAAHQAQTKEVCAFLGTTFLDIRHELSELADLASRRDAKPQAGAPSWPEFGAALTAALRSFSENECPNLKLKRAR
jgi:hypothetical protein